MRKSGLRDLIIWLVRFFDKDFFKFNVGFFYEIFSFLIFDRSEILVGSFLGLGFLKVCRLFDISV